MLFNSYIFIFAFLPITLFGYYLINRFKKPDIAQWWLFIASLFFYAYFNPSYLLLIVFSIAVNFAVNKGLHAVKAPKARKAVLALGLIIDIGVFIYFKYYDFFVENINAVFQTSFAFKHILLPLGISFFTFQQISYIIDCYRKEVRDYPFVYYASFVAFFPQLIAGPIVLHNEIIPQFLDDEKKTFDYHRFAKGVFAFTMGLGKKMLIADVFGKAVNAGYDMLGALNTTTALVVMLAYTFQIYFDFSGYCDMATGLGLMFNINITQNFNSPYKAVSIEDFWKRWHMTLTRFFRKYLYFPLGGNRKGWFRTQLNMLIVFLVSGFWHGANWTFVIWGALNGAAVLVHKNIKGLLKRWPKILGWALTFLFVNLAWILFRAPNLSKAMIFYRQLTAFNFGPVSADISAMLLPEMVSGMLGLVSLEGLRTILGTVFTLLYIGLALIIVVFMKNTNERTAAFKPTILNSLFVCIVFIWSVVSLTGVNIFIYFNF